MSSQSGLNSQQPIDVIVVAEGTNSNYNPVIVQTNIPSHQEGDIPSIELFQFIALNTFYNISAALKNNIFKTITTFGNNYAVNRVVIPDGNYTITTLLSYLNGTGTSNVMAKWIFPGGNTTTDSIFKSAEDSSLNTFQGVYIGAGYDYTLEGNVSLAGESETESLVATLHADSTLKTTAYLPFVLNANNVITLNPPPENVYYKVYKNGNSKSTDPFVVTNFGAVDDVETDGLLKTLGFKGGPSDSQPVPVAPSIYAYHVHMEESSTFTSTISYNTGITAQRAYNLAGVTVMYVCAPNMSTQTYSNNQTLNSLNVLAMIPVDVAYGDLITYDTNSRPIKIDNLDLSNLQILILDQDYNRVDFMGQRWTARMRYTFQSSAPYEATEVKQGGQDFKPSDVNSYSTLEYHHSNLTDRFGNKRMKRSQFN